MVWLVGIFFLPAFIFPAEVGPFVSQATRYVQANLDSSGLQLLGKKLLVVALPALVCRLDPGVELLSPALVEVLHVGLSRTSGVADDLLGAELLDQLGGVV